MIQLKTGVIVPCGKCPACLANQRAEWIFRLQQEYLASSQSLFVTLTYDDEHVPSGMNVRKQDVQLFHKRLRKHFKSGDLRYYVVAEYGDHTFRPHYHGLYFFKSYHYLEELYNAFESAWTLGFLKFGDVEEGSIVYCTKYCLKYKHIPEGRAPLFRLVSKMNGGLGINYLDKMHDYHVTSYNFTSVFHDGKRSRMPRYYRTKMQMVDGFDTSLLKQRAEDLYRQHLADIEKAFIVYCKMHHYDSYSDAVQGFNKWLRRSQDERDRLIMEHCKKQSM